MGHSCDLTVLVLGVGGNVGQGILKALHHSPLRCRVIGACVNPLAMGLYTVDEAHVSPAADDERFAPWLADLCRQRHVNAVLSGVEPVLTVMAQVREDLQRSTGAICIVSDPGRLALAHDKLLSCQWLIAHGFPAPRYALSSDADAVAHLVADAGFPLVAKPRFGAGSGGLLHLGHQDDLAFLGHRPDYLVQEYLGTARDEYTAGVFVDARATPKGAIVMRRELRAGATYRAEIGLHPEVREHALRIATALAPRGPCNIQFRTVEPTPVCFDINMRFSGTTPIRAHFGFNEVDAALRHFVLGEDLDELPTVTQGVGLRYWNEIYVSPQACERLREYGTLSGPHAWPTEVEHFGMHE